MRHSSTILLCLTVIISSSLCLSVKLKDPRHVGCYHTTSFPFRPWGDFTELVSGQMTTDSCVNACSAAGVIYFLSALLNGSQCWCASSFHNIYGTPTCDGCCNVPCQGDRSMNCGGIEAFDVYDSVLDKRYLGCYNDRAPPNSVLSLPLPYHYDLNTEKCITNCIERGYKFAGRVNSGECFCGNEDYARYGQCILESACGCRKGCPGSPFDICDGPLALSVYKAECKRPNTFGENCDSTCHCRNDTACNATTGECPNRECEPGWEGPACDEACTDGKFGTDCSKDCNCQNDDVCDKVDGSCPTGVCRPGYDGSLDPSCQTECQEGKFGLACKFNCRCHHSSDCDKDTGACEDDECSLGFRGPYSNPACQEECEAGTYGLDCAQECHCLNSAVCNNTNGHCPGGYCDLGYSNSDPTCQMECPAGTFGFDCFHKCQCDEDQSCDRVNGECKGGNGFSFLTSPPFIAVASLLGILSLVILILVTVLRRMCRKQEATQEKATKQKATQEKAPEEKATKQVSEGFENAAMEEGNVYTYLNPSQMSDANRTSNGKTQIEMKRPKTIEELRLPTVQQKGTKPPLSNEGGHHEAIKKSGAHNIYVNLDVVKDQPVPGKAREMAEVADLEGVEDYEHHYQKLQPKTEL